MSYSFTDSQNQQPIKDNDNNSLLDILQSTGRTIARTPINLLALASGIPGDIASLVNRYVAAPIAQEITGQTALPYEQTSLSQFLPTSRQEKEALTPEFLKPQNESEQLTDEIVENAVLLFSPVKGKLPNSTIIKPLAISIGSTLAGELVKDITGGDLEKASKAKLGTMFLATIANKANANKFVSALYKEAEALLPQGTRVNATNLSKNLDNLINKVSKGTKAASEQFVINEANAVKNKIQNGTISIEEAIASKRSLGEKLNDFLYQSPDRKARARARKLATQINVDLNNLIKSYGNQNKEFGRIFANAEEAYGAIQQSNFITRLVGKNLKYNPATSGLVNILTGGLGTAASSALLPYQATKLLYRITKSPTLRKYYTKTLGSAVKDNAIQFNRDLEKLDKAIQQDQSKDTYQFIN